MSPDAFANKLVEEAGDRVLIGVAGPPGSGKSTFSEALLKSLTGRGEAASVVPMDGFHLDNAVLQERGLLNRKGAPETFDADGFIVQIERLHRADHDVVIPLFDRALDKAIAGAAVVKATDRFVIVEGNYLLLKQKPWSALEQYFDETIFIDTLMPVLEQRLIARWQAHGYDAKAARQRALSNDIPNAKIVLEGSSEPTLSIF